MRRLLFALAILCSSVALASSSSRILIVGPDGLPLPGVTIAVGNAQFVSGSDGTVVVEGPSGTPVVANLDGFAPASAILSSETRIVMELAGVSDEITVIGVQSRVPLAELSSSVTVVDRDDIDRALKTSTNLADALGKEVPGLAPGNGTPSLYGQTIRGRNLQVLVDGVPLTTLRNGSRDLASIDPSIVERVEVLRGTTALYGDGATGGLINIITRQPERGETSFRTELTFHGSVSHPGDSAGSKIVQSATGTKGRFDWRFDLGAERTGAAFDADGDRLPPDPYGQGGMAESDSFSIFAKGGFAPSADARLTLSVSAFDAAQKTDWTTDPSVNRLPAYTTKARAIEGIDMEHPQGSENRLFQAAYEDLSLHGSTVRAQAYKREYKTVFTPFDGRNLAIYGRQLFQSYIQSDSYGARADVQTPLPVRGLTLFWGADAGSEQTEQPVWILDAAAYDASGGRTFRSTHERPWVPLVDKRTQAAFVQLEWMATSRWLLRGGVRHDRVQTDIPTFSTLAEVTIDGGERRWSDTLVNAGAVYYVSPESRIFASYSEGFSLPDIGLVLRGAPAGASLDTLPFAPQIVEGWELGWAAERNALQWSLAAFYSTSELGTSTAGFNQPVVRAPERVWGYEGELSYRPANRWNTGVTASWTEGKSDPNRDGVFTYLNNYRIAAPNATAWLEHELTSRWTNRLQVLWSGDRDRFGTSTAFGERPIHDYTVVDLISTFAMAAGDLTIGVQNLLNEQYFVRDAQLMRSGRNDSYTAAPGATVRIGWSFKY